ncbi:hypothetical protein [Oceanobacillus sojae]|uniref:hypothetical protein n=1 Tax=Oceanobacillus sojae TaxID=582851 RepID=UPI003640944D
MDVAKDFITHFLPPSVRNTIDVIHSAPKKTALSVMTSKNISPICYSRRKFIKKPLMYIFCSSIKAIMITILLCSYCGI